MIMKKLLTLFSFILFALTDFVYATAPSMTNVSATLTDTSTQVWTNGTWQATFQTPFGNPNTPSNNGNPVIQQYSGVLDGSGHFTVSLDDNNVVTPTGSHWVFTMCPNATVPVCSSATVLVTGVSQDLSSTLSAALTVPIVQTKPTIFRAYNDTEAFGGLGALYVNTTDNSLRLCNTPAGCPGSGWTAASVPSHDPVFTGTVTVNGDLHVTGDTQLDGDLNVDGFTTLTDLEVTNNAKFDGQVSVSCISYHHAILEFVTLCPQAGGPFSVNLPAAGGTLALTSDIPVLSVFGQTGHVDDTIAANTVIGNNTGSVAAPTPVKVTYSMTDATTIAPINNPIFTGDPQAPTPGSGDDDTSIATTHFVKTALINTPAVVAASTTTLGADVPVSASTTTTIISHGVTMPSSGCPCRVFAAYNIYGFSGAGLTTLGWVSDGTNDFASSLSTASGSNVNYAYTASSFTPVTYANSASVTFTMKVNSSDATTAKKNPPFGSAQLSYLNLVVMTSN